MAAYIKTLKDASRENTIYPITKTEAVYRPDNTTSVEEALVALESEVTNVLENTNGLRDIYETKNDASAKLTEAKTYADNAATTATASLKNELLNGAGGAYDTLKELGDLINDNQDAISALEAVAAGKADKVHAHTISDVTNLQSALDSKASQSDLDELETVIDGKANTTHSHAISDVTNLQLTLDTKVPTSRTINSKALSANITLSASDVGADASGSASAVQTNLDTHAANTSLHFTTAEKTKLSGIETGAQKNTITGVKGSSESTYRTGNVNITAANIGLGNVSNTSDANKPVSTAQQAAIDESLATSKSYTDTKISGLASTSSVNTSISNHNTSTSAHSDIRGLITSLTTKLNNFLDVDDTTTDQLSEVITLINNNKGTLESLTTSKVNVSDIVNNLTTNATNKPLSAAQGVVIKGLIDALQTEVDSKAESKHTHAISDITNLQTTLDSKANSNHTHTMPSYDLSASKSSTNGNVKLNLTAGGSASGTDSVTVVGGGATSVTTDAGGIVTIASTNTTYSSITNTEIDEICASSYSSILSLTQAEGVEF